MEIDKAATWRDSRMDPEFLVEAELQEFFRPGPLYDSHWHEQFQILWLQEGEAVFYCNLAPVRAQAGDLVIFNANDVHYGENIGRYLAYYLLKVDFAFLQSSQADVCQQQYIAPLAQNQILFHTHVRDDEALTETFAAIVREYLGRRPGCELAVKGLLYRLMVLLLRNHTVVDRSAAERTRQRRLLDGLRSVLNYMDKNYSDTVSLEQLAGMAGLSNHHFCRVFKKLTGKSPLAYINSLRIYEAAKLLQRRDLNVSEVAARVGFNDSNYFSRLFKKYQQVSPSSLRK